MLNAQCSMLSSSPKLRIAAIIPAAGLSSRMGRNKLLLNFRGKPLVRHAVETVLAAGITETYVVLGYEAEKVRAVLADLPVRFVANEDYRLGLSTSVRAGVKVVPNDLEAIIIYLADQPWIEPEDLAQLIGAFETAQGVGKSIVVPFYSGTRGNPVILAAKHREEILEISGDVGCKRVIQKRANQVLAIEMQNDHVIRDVDAPEDCEGTFA
jgi:molybdenum cofactor cytidylyltransferase